MLKIRHTILPIFLALFLIFNLGRRIPPYLRRPGPHSASPASTSTAARKRAVRFFSLNTFIRPMLVGLNDYKDHRLTYLLHALHPFDILCLQELFWTTGPRKARFLDNLASHHGFHYQASAPVPGLPGLLRFPPKIIDAGLVIASKFPIVKTEYHTFSQAISRSIDYIVAKGALYARVSLFADAPERYAHVFTMHLQANNGLQDVPFDKVRRTQLVEIARFVSRMTEDDPMGVVILAGDFNVDARAGFDDPRSSDEYREAVRVLQRIRSDMSVRDLLYEANNHSHPVTTAGGLKGTHQTNERLDYIFLSAVEGGQVELEAEVKDGSVQVSELWVGNNRAESEFDTLSDHYGVRAEILFSEPE